MTDKKSNFSLSPPFHDLIDESSEDSFPASDSPSWIANENNEVNFNKKNKCQTSILFKNKTLSKITIDDTDYYYFSLSLLEKLGLSGIERLPITLKILLENLIRNENGITVKSDDIIEIQKWLKEKKSNCEISYHPVRVLMQDFTGVPAVVDLASMRDAIKNLGGDPESINPISPVDLVIDHSIQVDEFIKKDAFKINADIEMSRNYERYEFLRWGQKAFKNFRVVPPDTGICHQVNLEYLSSVVCGKKIKNQYYVYPDTIVGTDSHTTMINGLGVLGWGVGGIEAEAAVLGQPISMIIPEVIGVKLTGKLKESITATDLVLSITNILRKKGVVGKFVEFFGSGIGELSVPDRATIANMSPEYGATCAFFPIDKKTLQYLELTGRSKKIISLVEAYSKAQGLWQDEFSLEPIFSEIVELDLSTIKITVSGPKRPQDQVDLSHISNEFDKLLIENNRYDEKNKSFYFTKNNAVHHGDVVIAAITSCTNTSNPSVLISAALVAKKALERGLTRKPWVKTSFAPGSQVVTHYLKKMGLQNYLDQLGFSLVGYGCTTCIGNSGPLIPVIADVIDQYDLIVSAVLSGNRNFEGRIHPQVKANWLASPPLVVIFAITGTVKIDLINEPIGYDQKRTPVFLKDLWPTNLEIMDKIKLIKNDIFQEIYKNIFNGTDQWNSMKIIGSKTYEWKYNSTYIQNPPFFDGMTRDPPKINNIINAHILAILGDSVTTDHISPAGSIKSNSPAGIYLKSKGVSEKDFNSLGSRRGNHEVMMRGTFSNNRIRNEIVPNMEGGVTRFFPTNEVISIYDAAMRYKKNATPLIVIAGKEYGTGSSRDWAAKGPKLLGVVAVIAESFERIHRSNLVGMGVLPLEFMNGMTRKKIGFNGSEKIDILGIEKINSPHSIVNAVIYSSFEKEKKIDLLVRIDTWNELTYYKHGGILHYVIRSLL